MKANELRIGNKIIVYKADMKPIIETVRSVSDYSGHINTYEDFHYFRIDEAHPINLTHEILEKCGFIEDNLSYYKGCIELYYQRSYKSYFFKYGYILNSSEAIEINHVHKLQNLIFALTGEELECAF